MAVPWSISLPASTYQLPSVTSQAPCKGRNYPHFTDELTSSSTLEVIR